VRRDSPGSHRRRHRRSRSGRRAPEASGSPVHDRRRAVKELSRRSTSVRARARAQAPPHGRSTAARSLTGERTRRREAPRRHRCLPLAATGGRRSVLASVRCGRKGGGEKKESPAYARRRHGAEPSSAALDRAGKRAAGGAVGRAREGGKEKCTRVPGEEQAAAGFDPARKADSRPIALDGQD